jgi:O-acetylhomoserine (thiol)-lyase
LPDLRAIAKRAHERGIPVIADNTMATPHLLRPIDLGADIVIHSASKFLSGNGTVMGGCVVDSGKFTWKNNPRFPAFNQPDESYHGLVYADLGATAFIIKLRAHILRDIGACMSPFNAWITLLGMETLSLRMQKLCENSQKTAEFLQSHPKVASVSYAGLPGSPYKALCEREFSKGCGATYTFDIKGGKEDAARFCDNLELIQIITNLGDSITLCSCPAATTHSQLSKEQLKAAGLSPGTVRLSVGLEDARDLIADMAGALEKV